MSAPLNYPPSATPMLDIDFRGTQAAVHAILAGYGFSTVGTVDATNFDTSLGFNGLGLGEYRQTSLQSWSANAGSEFTIILDVRRVDIAKDKGVNAVTLYDSEGRTGAASVETILQCGEINSATFGLTMKRYGAAQTTNSTKIDFSARTGVSATAVGSACSLANYANFNSHYSTTYDDPNGFIELAMVGKAGVCTVYVDGWPYAQFDSSDNGGAWNREIFTYIKIAGAAGSARFTGWMRRLRIWNVAASIPYSSGCKIALVGDSFCMRGTNQGNYTPNPPESVAHVDANQPELTDAITLNKTSGTHWNAQFTPNQWVHILQRWCVRNGLNPFRLYNASLGGYSWAQTSPAQFPDILFDAVVAYKPEIVIAVGSVNDATGVAGSTTNLLSLTRTKLDILIDGLPGLKRILFVQTFPKEGQPASAEVVADYKVQIALQEQLDGYRDIVTFVPSYETLGGDGYDQRFNMGTYFPDTPDVHPGGFGMLQMAEVIWPYLKTELQSRPRVGTRPAVSRVA